MKCSINLWFAANRKLKALALSTLIAGVGVGASLGALLKTDSVRAQTPTFQTVVNPGNPFTFSCNESELSIRTRGTPRVRIGNTRIFVGYQQVTADNQNPIVARFDNGVLTWCRTNYERSNDDGRAYGLLWDGAGFLYAVFSATGTQGTADQDYRRFSTEGWLPTYGAGGGRKVAVIARLDPATGLPFRGTFLTALNSSNQTNSLEVTGLNWTGTHLIVSANSWFSPRRIDRRAMVCTGSSPFRYQIVLAPGLRQAVAASATGCI